MVTAGFSADVLIAFSGEAGRAGAAAAAAALSGFPEIRRAPRESSSKVTVSLAWPPMNTSTFQLLGVGAAAMTGLTACSSLSVWGRSIFGCLANKPAKRPPGRAGRARLCSPPMDSRSLSVVEAIWPLPWSVWLRMASRRLPLLEARCSLGTSAGLTSRVTELAAAAAVSTLLPMSWPTASTSTFCRMVLLMVSLWLFRRTESSTTTSTRLPGLTQPATPADSSIFTATARKPS